jgi:hypothetical protein
MGTTQRNPEVPVRTKWHRSALSNPPVARPCVKTKTSITRKNLKRPDLNLNHMLAHMISRILNLNHILALYFWMIYSRCTSEWYTRAQILALYLTCLPSISAMFRKFDCILETPIVRSRNSRPNTHTHAVCKHTNTNTHTHTQWALRLSSER